MIHILLAAAAAVSSPGPAEEVRTVRIELRDGGRVMGTPVITVAPGSGFAVMQVSGPRGYRLSVALDSAPAPAAYTLRLGYDRPAGDGWTRAASPVLRVAADGHARIEIDNGRDPAVSMSVRID